MFRNYIITAIRNLWKNKVFSVINISSLALGMATTILILLWAMDELSYDKFHKDHNRICRVISKDAYDNTDRAAGVYWLTDYLRNNIPEIENDVRCMYYDEMATYEDRKYNKVPALWADSTFFDIFSFPLIQGNKETVLLEPASVVISTTMAKRLFQDEDPVGHVIDISEIPLKVTGVFKDIPRNSHMQFDLIIPLSLLRQLASGYENEGIFYTYVLLNENVSIDELNNKLQNLNKKTRVDIRLQPLSDIHLYSSLSDDSQGLGIGGDIKYVRIYLLLAFLVMLIACINFINLSTAGSINRTAEIGLRKVNGASRRQLVFQFLAESLIIAFIACILAITIVELILPQMEDLSGKQLTLSYSATWTIPALISIVIVTGLFAGSYPALFLSSLKPVDSIKGALHSRPFSSVLRKILVVFQFTLSIFLMICAIGVNKQLQFMLLNEPGYNKDQVIFIPPLEKYDAFRTELLQSPYVSDVTAAGFHPLNIHSSTNIYWQGSDSIRELHVNRGPVAENFADFFEIPFLTGASFQCEKFTDSTMKYIINEEAAKHMEIKDPTCTNLREMIGGGRFRRGVITGIIRNFHYSNYKRKIAPMMLYLSSVLTGDLSYVYVKLKADNISEGLKVTEQTYNSFDTYYPYDHTFLDTEYEKQFRAEKQTGILFSYFTMLGFIISCLGLVALSTYTVRKRIKEIAVRKIFGASEKNIIKMLSFDILKWVFVAFIIALPIAMFYLNNWLENYAYATGIEYWWFILAGITVIIITQLITLIQTLRAARSNPADSLKHE